MAARRHPIRFGLQLTPEGVSWPDLLAVARFADRLGFDSLFTSDHLLSPLRPQDPDAPCLEGWTTLAGLAAATERARLGVLVTAVTYRHPSVLAKVATTVDHISGGRLILGIGAAWYRREHDAYGIAFYPNAERVGRLREAVQIIKALWTQPPATYAGRYYQLRDAPFSPPPVQEPRPPIWIGGWGERLTLRVVAEEADGWNVTGSPGSLRPKLEALERHCEAVGRDMADIEKSVMHLRLVMAPTRAQAMRVVEATRGGAGRSAHAVADDYLLGTPAEMQDLIGRLVDLGFTHFVPQVTAPYDYEGIRRFAEEVVPAFRR